MVRKKYLPRKVACLAFCLSDWLHENHQTAQCVKMIKMRKAACVCPTASSMLGDLFPSSKVIAMALCIHTHIHTDRQKEQ